MKKVLHILRDSNIFISVVKELFENQKTISNDYFVERLNRKSNKIEIENNNKYIRFNYLFNKKIRAEIINYDIIILHFLSKNKAKLIAKSNTKALIIWAVWGGDIYNSVHALKKITLEPKTKQLFKQNATFKDKIKGILLNLYLYKDCFYWQKKALEKITYIAPVIYDDYELIKKYYNAPHLKFINFSYGNLEENLLNGISERNILGNNILLGNSASYTNNHIEAFDILDKIKLENRKIITPLSYGGVKLKNYVIDYGSSKLKNNFYALENFMNLENYHKLLTSCGYVIMNHRRQEAMGNIITMMYLGAKIFLNKQNPVYEYFKRLGAYVFLIDEITEKKEKAFVPLTQEQINKNREILIQTRSKKVVDGFIQKIAEL